MDNLENQEVNCAEELNDSYTATEPLINDGKGPDTGVVTGCLSLNIRQQASISSAKLAEVYALDELLIEQDKSTNDFYKVTTSAGISGFASKQYVTLK